MGLLKVKPGDIVVIPCEMSGEWGLVYSRVIFVGVAKWIEVFDEFNVDFDTVLEGAKSENLGKISSFQSDYGVF